MSGVDDRDGQKGTHELLALLLEWIREADTGSIGDEDLLTRLYLLRDLAQASAPLLGLDGIASAGWISRCAAILRDEADRDHAVRLLQLVADQLRRQHPPASPDERRTAPEEEVVSFESRHSIDVELARPSEPLVSPKSWRLQVAQQGSGVSFHSTWVERMYDQRDTEGRPRCQLGG